MWCENSHSPHRIFPALALASLQGRGCTQSPLCGAAPEGRASPRDGGHPRDTFLVWVPTPARHFSESTQPRWAPETTQPRPPPRAKENNSVVDVRGEGLGTRPALPWKERESSEGSTPSPSPVGLSSGPRAEEFQGSETSLLCIPGKWRALGYSGQTRLVEAQAAWFPQETLMPPKVGGGPSSSSQ